MRRAAKGITVVEAVFISSITILLGFVLMFLASGWAQISMHDLTQKTNEHIQAFRSILVVELVKYSESSIEIKIRNVSKWNASLKITEVEVLRDGRIVSRLPENVLLAKGEAADLPIPVDCKRGSDLTARIKYISAASSERDLPPSVIEFNFTCPISMVPTTCDLAEKWAFIDIIDPITASSGEISQEYPFIWIRAPLSSIERYESINVIISGQEGSYSSMYHVRLPSVEQMPLRIRGESMKPPYNITIEGSSLTFIPRSFVLGALIENDEVKAHVSGVTLLWRPEDKVIKGLIVWLRILAPGDYVIRINLENCHGAELLALKRHYRYAGEGGIWDFLYVEFAKELKITDVYSVKTFIVEEEP